MSRMDADPDECRNCTHDRSWHTPVCEECVNEEPDDRDDVCHEFVGFVG